MSQDYRRRVAANPRLSQPRLSLPEKAGTIRIRIYLSPVHTSNNVEVTCNTVEATFDIVERIVQLVAFDNVAWTLLLVWTDFTIITPPLICSSFNRPTKGGRLTLLRHCKKGVQPVPKAVYRAGCRDKHNCPR